MENTSYGLVAGSASTIALYPLDLIKVRMQVYDGVGSRYNSLIAGFRTITREEGYKALYKGMSPGLLASALSWGGYFYFYELSKKRRLASKGRSSLGRDPAGQPSHQPQMTSSASHSAEAKLSVAASAAAIAEEGELAADLSLIDASLHDSQRTEAIHMTGGPRSKVSASASSESASDVPAAEKLDTSDHLLAGIEAGAIMVLVTNPLWLMKTRLQLQTDHGPTAKYHYKGFSDAFRTILREEGALGFYRGFVPAMLLTSHGAVQFAVYEQAKTSYQALSGNNSPNQQPPWLSMILGGFSKIAATCATYPYQVLKSRLQQRGEETEVASKASANGNSSSSSTSTSSIHSNSSSSSVIGNSSYANHGRSMGEGTVKFRPKYSGVLDCLVKTIRHEGVSGFFKGLVPNCLRVAPASAITFVVYEELLKLL